MSKIVLSFLFLIISISFLLSQEIQNSSNIWYFGDRAGLDFNTNPPIALTDGQLNTQEGVATVSNSNGDLLFYTNGISVWDQTHQIMPNANGTLNGHNSSTQSAVIVPNLSNPDLYYIFTTDELAGNNGLSYTSIDLSIPGNGSANNPLGDIVVNELNIQLASPVTEKVVGILKSDFSAYWIIAHGWNNNRFYAYEVTCDGINTSPVISEVGNIHSGGFDNLNAVGYIKAPIDGQNLALVNRNNGTIDLYDFDKTTGIVSNEIQIFPNNDLTYGIEFSPSGDYLYIGGRDIISKYTISTGQLENIDIDIPSAVNSENVIRALQLGPDENIYVSVRHRDYISVIFDPDSNDASLTVNGIFLNPNGDGRNCRFGLPNIFYFDLLPLDSITLIACPASAVEYNGDWYSTGSINEINLVGNDGCDSTIILIVDSYNSSNGVLEVEACDGDFYEYNGNQIPAGTQEVFTFVDSNACDSIITLIVDLLESSDEVLDIESCEGSFYEYNGSQILAGTQETFNFVNSNGCDSIITVVVNIVDFIESTIIVELCEGDDYFFYNDTYPIGTDTLIHVDGQNGCDTFIMLSVLSSPVVDFVLYPDHVCWNEPDNGSITIQNINAGLPPFSFSLDGQNFDSDTVFNNLQPDMYNIWIMDANDCIYEQNIEVMEIPEIIIEMPEPIISCDDDSILVAIDVSNGFEDGLDWEWANGADTNYIYVSQPGIYSFDVSNACQTIEQSIIVKSEEEARTNFIYIPNVFSPNDDGHNDFFQLFPADDIEILSVEFQLFNRWGALIFKTEDINFTWDGCFKDSKLNPGVYVWWLKANIRACKQEIEIYKEGDLTLIR